MRIEYTEKEVFEKWYKFLIIRKLWRPNGIHSPGVEIWYFIDEGLSDNLVVKSRELSTVERAFKEAICEVLLEAYNGNPIRLREFG
jgi:hypothetical protein